MTLVESAANAVLPWNSLDAEEALLQTLPQQSIDLCLMCQHCAAHCDTCSDWTRRNTGRPKKEIDYELLHEMMQLRRCNREMCAALGIGVRTLQKLKKDMN